MIRTLRIKLVTASMLSLLLVLSAILGCAAVLNYQKVVSEADSILSVLSENNGTFPDDLFVSEQPPRQPKNSLGPGAASRAERESGANAAPGPKPGAKPAPRPPRHLSPELPYESRYFSVTLSSDGTTLSTNTGQIAAVDADTAVLYAKRVLQTGKAKGFFHDYRYIISQTEGVFRIIFLDCGRSLRTFHDFLFTSAEISLAGLFTVLLLLLILSSRIVKPFIENDEKQKRFITDAGHELKTPLTILNADAALLEMDFGENEWVRDIQTQTERLAQLTDSLILLSRMEETQTPAALTDVSLSDLAAELAQAFQSPAQAGRKTLSCSIEPMLSVRGDANALRQLISLLLDNAVKYAPENGHITLSLQRQRHLLCLVISNTAEFIAQEDLPHLFDRFYRTDQSRSSQTGGHGLGLSIAAVIVKNHKGKIWASSPDAQSLVITVTLPLL